MKRLVLLDYDTTEIYYFRVITVNEQERKELLGRHGYIVDIDKETLKRWEDVFTEFWKLQMELEDLHKSLRRKDEDKDSKSNNKG
jgi:hypothetical protein